LGFVILTVPLSCSP